MKALRWLWRTDDAIMGVSAVTGKPASARPVRWETAGLAWFIPPPREVQAHPKNYEGPDIEQEVR